MASGVFSKSFLSALEKFAPDTKGASSSGPVSTPHGKGMSVSVSVEGLGDLDRRLMMLAGKEAKKIIRKALRAGAYVVMLRAKENASGMSRSPKGIGKIIADNLAVRSSKSRRRGKISMEVQIEPDSRLIHVTKKGYMYYIPAAIEYGHEFPGRGGSDRLKQARAYAKAKGRDMAHQVKPVGFMRKAWDSTKQRALDTTIRKAWSELDRRFAI